MPPESVTHYEVLERVGQGGMGTVYRARDVLLQRTVALKFLSPELTSSPEARARFFREGQALSALSHPNIATVYEVDNVDDAPFLALEYLPGGTLQASIQQASHAAQPLTLEQLVEWGSGIASGLAHAHRNGVIHRDVKSSNVMFDAEGRIKLTDFGLAKTTAQHEGSVTGPVMGTYHYLAPELVEGQAATPSSDLFSLGVLLYEMSTGKLPFVGRSVAEVLHKVLDQDPPPPASLRPDLPPAFGNIVLRLLSKIPAERQQDGDQVVRELRTLLSSRSPNASDAPTLTLPVQRLRPWARRRALWVVGSIGLAIVLVLFWGETRKLIRGYQLPAQKQVAVLPFRSIGGDASQEAFCDGLTELLTTAISKQGDFSVVPPTEARGLQTAEQARREFGVNLVVYGSVQFRGEKVRLIIALIDAQTRRQIDAQPLEWPVSRLYELEDGALSKIADLLNLVSTPTVSPLMAGATQLPAAYDAYLRGRGFLYRYDKAGNLERALDQFQLAIRLDQKFAAAWVGLAETQLRNYRERNEEALLDSARMAAERAKELGPNLAGAHIVLGGVLADMQRPAEAIRELETASRLDPQDAWTYRELGRLYNLQARFADAEQLYQRALALRPSDWMVAMYAASFYQTRQRTDESEKLYRKAISLSPDNYAPYRNLGGLLFRLGRYREAEQMMLKAQQLNPTSIGYSNLAALYMLQRRYTEAVPMAKLAAERAPRDSPNEYRIWGNLGDAYWLARMPQPQAVEAWTKAAALARAQLARTPADMRILATLAKFEAKIGQNADAIRDAGDAVRRDPANAAIRFQAALALALAGRHNEALDELAKALELKLPVSEIREAPELEPLRNLPRFKQLTSSSNTR
jgi:tetratricopeptide (TPR) repeat protein/tRNA A-37 threonylcarbamoyl transferase component Bud32